MTTPPTDSAADSPTTATPIVYWLLIAGTIAVAAFTFVISFVGLRDYGVRLMGLSPQLANLVPLGVDVFSLCGIAATYLLARAPARIRLYAWTVFLVPAGLSVAGNLAHAQARDLASAGMVGAAAAPIVLALAAHLVVVVRRQLLRDSLPASQPTPTSEPSFTQPSAPETLSPAEAEAAQPRRPHNATPDEVRLLALRLLDDGADFAQAATEVGVTARTVQRWFDERVAAVKVRSRRPRAGRRNGQPGGDTPVTAPPADPAGTEPTPAPVGA